MNKPRKLKPDHIHTIATNSGPNPGDYPAGSIESRAAARATFENRAVQLAADELELTPLEEATAEGVTDPLMRAWVIELVRGGEERAVVFGYELPSPEWVRYRRRMIQMADEFSDGRCSKLCLQGGPDWVRWICQAREKLAGQGICPPETPAPQSWESIFREHQTAD